MTNPGTPSGLLKGVLYPYPRGTTTKLAQDHPTKLIYHFCQHTDVSNKTCGVEVMVEWITGSYGKDSLSLSVVKQFLLCSSCLDFSTSSRLEFFVPLFSSARQFLGFWFLVWSGLDSCSDSRLVFFSWLEFSIWQSMFDLTSRLESLFGWVSRLDSLCFVWFPELTEFLFGWTSRIDSFCLVGLLGLTVSVEFMFSVGILVLSVLNSCSTSGLESLFGWSSQLDRLCLVWLLDLNLRSDRLLGLTVSVWFDFSSLSLCSVGILGSSVSVWFDFSTWIYVWLDFSACLVAGCGL